MMNICIVAGARPNFIKIAPLLRAIKKVRDEGQSVAYSLVYTGSESDSTLEGSLFEDLQMQRPDVFLEAKSDNLNTLTGEVMMSFENYLRQHPTDIVIVVDDLASTMAVSIVTKKQNIKLAHLVAGTRSFDINMPKEINRMVIDGLSDYLFTAGVPGNNILSREGKEFGNVFMAGNILMDTVRQNFQRFQKPEALGRLGIKDGGYILFTLNRKALLRERGNLHAMLQALLSAAKGTPVIAPLRPLAAEVVGAMMSGCEAFHIVPPLSYLEFGYLMGHAMGVVTDSGNVAEEATFYGRPAITLNSYTEHIETVKIGSNVLVGESSELLFKAVRDLVDGKWKKCALPENWDGHTAERIIQILLNR